MQKSVWKDTKSKKVIYGLLPKIEKIEKIVSNSKTKKDNLKESSTFGSYKNKNERPIG